MSDNIVLDILQAMRADIGELKADTQEIKERVGLLEGQYAGVSRRLDRVGGDVEMIKKRLGLIEA